MNKTAREIECLTRLDQLTGQSSDIMYFLKDEGLIPDASVKNTKNSPSPIKELHVLIKSLQRDNKLQLLEYEWQILPVERITLSIVTDRSNKKFSYEG